MGRQIANISKKLSILCKYRNHKKRTRIQALRKFVVNCRILHKNKTTIFKGFNIHQSDR
jgi:hypothetical protein